MYHYKIKKKKRVNKRVIIWIISLFLLAGLAYILFLSPIFTIKTIAISGNKEISTDEIKNSLICKNIFLTTRKGIENELLKKFPKILDLRIKKNLFRRELQIDLKEREEIGIICRAEKCFYIDNNGIIFEYAPQTSGSLVTLIKDFSERDYKLGDKVADKEIINNISAIKEYLLSELDLKVSSFDITGFPIEELRVVTKESWYLMFSLRREIKSQLSALKAALNEKIKNRIGLQYIDLRIENRIYYK